jgi:two-component system, NtrC family, nitrogen regulation sensor histidine kinase NtrY
MPAGFIKKFFGYIIKKDDRKYFTIVFLILLLVFAVGFIAPVIIQNKTDNWDEELTGQINEIKSDALRLYDQKENRILTKRDVLKSGLKKVLSPPRTSYRELIRLVNEKRFSGFSVQVLAPNGRIIAWNEYIAIPQEEIFPLSYPPGQTYFYSTELITYLTITDTVHIEHDIFYCILSIPIEKHYSLQSPYYLDINFSNELSEKFYTQFEAAYSPIAEKSKDGRNFSFDLLNNKGNKIGVITFVKPSLAIYSASINKISGDIQAVLVVAAFIFLSFGFRKDYREVTHRSVKILFLIIYLVLFRILLFALEFPARFIDQAFQGLTDPALFSSTFAWGIVKSPVEYTITVLIFLIISLYIFRNILVYKHDESINKTQNKFFSVFFIILLTVIFFLSVRGIAASVKSVIFDSTIRYFKEPDLIPDFPALVMNLNTLCFGVGAVLLLSGFVILILHFFSNLVRNTDRKNFFIIFSCFLVFGILFFIIQNNPLITPLLLFLIISFIFFLSYHFYKKGLSPYNYVYAALVASVLIITLLNYFNLKLERQSLRTIAFEINRPNDNLMRYMIDETLRSASTDRKIINYFSRKNTNFDALSFLIWSNSSLQRESLQSSVAIFDKDMNERGRFAVGLDPEQIEFDFADLTGTNSSISDFSGESYENLFIGIIPVIDRGTVSGYISAAVAYDLQTISNKNIPDFLESRRGVVNSVLDIKQLKIFEFTGSRVNKIHGDIYPSRDQAEPILNAEFSEDGEAWVMLTINEEEYQAFLTRIPGEEEDKITAVVLREKQFTWNLFNFFKIFVLHSLFILILLISIFLAGVKKINYTFRAKLLVSFLIISIIPVVVLALYNRHVVQERSRTAIVNELNERSNYLENHIRVQRDRHSGRDLITIFVNAGRELGISFGAYESTNLLYNSREKFYSAGLFSDKLNSQAHYHMNYLSYREFLSREKIENFEYDSFYKMISIDDKNVILGVNDAFNKVDIIYTAIDMDVFLFGIYSFAVLIIIIISTILANNISAPIRRLTKATVSVAQGDLNVEIMNREKGELRDLIEGFNAMTRELQKNQLELAELERENAWKEMAKQVAHEIKNPLTPLKLAVQQLVASYKDKSDKFDTVFEKVTQTVLGQIENLSSIATEFSRFAKMPSLKLEKTDLLKVINDTVNLFVDEKVKINILSDLEEAVIEADVNQLRRMIINLVRNSIQADANEINIKIESASGNFIILFSDNGTGIPAGMSDKIFDANFTTKEKGMGLGLKLAKRFLEGINGGIELYESSGTGTVFRITIPEAE